MWILIQELLEHYDIMIGIIGHGFVGNAISTTLNNLSVKFKIYDKFQPKHNDPKILVDTDICFVCVNTPAQDHSTQDEINQNSDIFGGYDLTPVYDVMNVLEQLNYQGIIVIKSTILPGTINKLAKMYPWAKDKLVHNPEFLTARTAAKDFQSQQHIVLGAYDTNGSSLLKVKQFYEKHFSTAIISVSNAINTECMKSFCNCFYASKVQIFTEFYLMCECIGADYSEVVKMMLNNQWINPMHTCVPGPDGKISFGGKCFVKDLTALVKMAKTLKTMSNVLESVLKERHQIRN